jgi:hypothetical protein
MSKTSIIVAAMLAAMAAPAGAADHPADTALCTPTAPPADAGSEDGNPGAGGRLGLNQDFHDEDFRLGAVLNEVVRQLASDGAPGDARFFSLTVGNDCRNLDLG